MPDNVATDQKAQSPACKSPEKCDQKRANELFMELEANGGLAELKVELKLRKAYEFLEENAEIKIVPRKKPELKEAGGK